ALWRLQRRWQFDPRKTRRGSGDDTDLASQNLLSPRIKQPAADRVFARDLGRRHLRTQALRHDRAFLLRRPNSAAPASHHLPPPPDSSRPTLRALSAPRTRGDSPPMAPFNQNQAPHHNTSPPHRLRYAGDDGGIVCRLEAAAETAEAVFASITHLRFDPRLPV